MSDKQVILNMGLIGRLNGIKSAEQYALRHNIHLRLATLATRLEIERYLKVLAQWHRQYTKGELK